VWSVELKRGFAAIKKLRWDLCDLTVGADALGGPSWSVEFGVEERPRLKNYGGIFVISP